MQIRKLTYTVAKLKKDLFKDIKLTRLDISFMEGD